MGMDRNQVIGFVLIGVLLIGMFAINSQSRLAYEAEQKRISDSLAALKPKVLPRPKVDTLLKADSVNTAEIKKGFALAGSDSRIAIIENDLVKIGISEKGGQPVVVELKKFKGGNGKDVVLQRPGYDKLSYEINTADNHTEASSDLLFTAEPVILNPDGSRSISFKAADSAGKEITHTYVLKANDYMLDLAIGMKGRNELISGNHIDIAWQSEAPVIENNPEYERTQTLFCYYSDEEDFDFEYVAQNDELKLSGPVSWVGLKQQFFVKALVSEKKFSSANTSWSVPADTGMADHVARAEARTSIELAPGSVATIPLQLYYGPSDYAVLKGYGNHMEEIVPYGSGIFAFVKYINRYLLLPVFDFFQRSISNMGIVILLLTLFIRLITSPILYKSYLSGAKMKVLKPEVDELRKKFTDPRTKELDQQAFSMEQMKLWRTAGVSPLGGCLPALLQIPIFMSLYYFFQSNIDLRGKSFLWAPDLSAFDSILDLSFNIPFYGSHVSLFTLTAVVTSLLISIYSMSQMQDNSNPMMKYMPYIFPALLLGVFNSLPSALTWYYTVSNIITLILQFIIQKYIINHDKIVREIEENKKKPVSKSKFQQRFEEMQESQRKLQDLKKKGGK